MPLTSAGVRSQLVQALRLDLVGPGDGLGDPAEVLPQPPSRWYLTGFLVPVDASEDQRTDPDANDDLELSVERGGADDDVPPEPAAVRQRFLPSSIGLSVLLPPHALQIVVSVRWGDYLRQAAESDGEARSGGAIWLRKDRLETILIDLPDGTQPPQETPVPDSGGLVVALSVRPVSLAGLSVAGGGLPAGTRAASVFVKNSRGPAPDERRDEAFAFQVELEVECHEGFVARPNVRGLVSDDWDERVADLQYRDANEFAVGHNVATDALNDEPKCLTVRTCWIPAAEVERVAPSDIPNVELSMDALALLADGSAVVAALGPIVPQYRAWILGQRASAPQQPLQRAEVSRLLMDRADVAANRIERGIQLLADPDCLEAFRIANRVMALAARRRMGAMLGLDPGSISPKWRPFQIAFILMNLEALANPHCPDREVVDLLFFPTGGGKTEAYLGLAAFILVLRRLRHPGIESSGMTVLMRYTLRLLTLDQLGRAATLICALELEREQNPGQLGKWPFEIGLWVGKAGTPNRMGRKGERDPDTARAKTIAYKNNSSKPKPIPLEECPWCGTKFSPNSFQLKPNPDTPTDLRVVCVSRDCAFAKGRPLPIVAVDEPIYRRLPCFLIATVDKFAAMPWTGEVGGFFGLTQRSDAQGFYGPCAPPGGSSLPQYRLPPPDLIIQDELHLISGPVGTLFGLYESALDELCSVPDGEKRTRPKIVASTATVRRAEGQIRALFNRHTVDVFPPPGPDRRNSFFAVTHSVQQSNARLYLGVAAQGRSPKVALLRVGLALLAAAQKAYSAVPGRPNPGNPADPYMTLLGYFNSLRELGGSRRLIEDEVRNRLSGYAARKRVGELQGVFSNRQIGYEPLELTSRVSTAKVSEAKRRLALPFSDDGRADVAIATNMISVGLDITRLGLMVVFGQPKTSAEYIQATSRVGRDPDRPGLVVTIMNVHRPRDRSHYERFGAYHASFYRSVEATSVTPFSPRALDRGLAGTLVALARHGHLPMTPPRAAAEILNEFTKLVAFADALSDRCQACCGLPDSAEAAAMAATTRARSMDLLDDWSAQALEYTQTGTGFQYGTEVGAAQPLLHGFLDPSLRGLPPQHPKMKFRANRSLRDVEPDLNLWIKTIDGISIEDDTEAEE